FGDVWEALHEAATAAPNSAPAPVAAAGAAAASARGADGSGSTAAPHDTCPMASGGSDNECDAPSSRPPQMRVTIRARCRDLRRIEVVGAAAGTALARVLQPLSNTSPACSSDGAGASGGSDADNGGSGGGVGGGDADEADLGASIWQSVWRSSEAGGTAAGACEGAAGQWRWRWPAGAVIGMVAADPRLAAPVAVGAAQADALVAASATACVGSGGGSGGCGVGTDSQRRVSGGLSDEASRRRQQQRMCERPRLLQEEELRRQFRQWPEAGDWTAGASALWRTHEPERPTSSSSGLDRSSVCPMPVPPPMSQSAIDDIRRAVRRQVLRAGMGLALQAQGGVPEASRTTQAQGHVTHGSAASFPVLLIRRSAGLRSASVAGSQSAATERHEAVGWSMVLPARWVMPVWLALTFTGARPMGQLEWRQVAAHWRSPCFPYDHPFTPAGEKYNRGRFAELVAAASKRPMGRARIADASPLADWTRLARFVDISSPSQPPEALLGGPKRQPPGLPPSSSNSDKAVPFTTLAYPPTGPEAVDSSQRLVNSGAAMHLVDGSEVPSNGGIGAACTPAPVMPVRSWGLILSDRLLRRIEQGAGIQQGGSSGMCGKIKSSLQGWTLRKALKLGLLTPTVAPVRAQPVPALHVEALPQQAPQPPMQHLVFVGLRVVGPGVCEAGAEVLMPCGDRKLAVWGSCSDFAPQRVAPEDCNVVQQAASAALEQHGVSKQALLLGYVVSAAPLGSELYPGGLAVCDAGSLARLLASDESQTGYCRRDAVAGTAATSACSGWVVNSKLLPSSGRGSANGRVVRVWVRNHGSVALRSCNATVLLEYTCG
ncbi:hypothetical protein Agub_g2262, partial [Astrephomene gubernaculifera]